MTAQMNELVVIEPQNALSVFTTPDALDPYLQRIRQELDAFVPDVSTAKGRKEIASMAHRVARSKTYLDGVGKQLADEQKQIPKKIDASRKLVRDTLDQWKEEVRQPLTDWEQAEDDRVARHEENLESIRSAGERASHEWADLPLDAMRERLAAVEAEAITEAAWEEFTSRAAEAKDAAITQLRDAIARREAYDAEQAELERLRREAEEREAKEREEAIRREAEERARREAEEKARQEREAAEAKARAEQEERDRKEREAKAEAERKELEHKLALERAEREKAEAEQRAKDAAEAERRRIEAEKQREAEEAAKREANKRHKAKVNNAAMQALVEGGLSEDQAKLAVTLIAQKSIPAVLIQY